jgi:ABC-type branched-subunit amino acid transport system substrate-binding protein
MNALQWAARCAATFALVASGAAGAANIVVGQVAPLSGLEAAQGRAYGVGMQLYFNNVNKAGGAGGHTFTLVRKDDGGRPEDTVALTKTLLAEDKPTILAGYFGSRNINDLVASGLLEKEKIALVGYRTAEIRPETPMLFNVRATLRDEVNKLVEHLSTIGITRLGLLYEQGPGAPALLAATDEAAAKAKAQVIAKASYPAGEAKVGPAVDTFIKAAPQAIIMVSTGAAAAAFIEQYRAANGAAQLFAHSGADVEQMAKRLSDEQMQGVAIAQVTPSPYKIANRLAKEFTDAAAKAGNLETPVSYAMMEGYIAAKVIVEAAKRAGPRASREALVSALEGMDSYDLGGYLVGFRPNQRSGSRFVELSIISGSGKIRQ